MTERWKVAAVQLDCRHPKAEVVKRAIHLIGQAAGKEAAAVCLPEHWLPWETGIDDTLSLLQEGARDAGVHLITGGDFSTRDGKTTVDSVVIGPHGEEMGRQQKTHLFRSEKERAQAGSGYRVFDMDGVRVGIAICHDLVFPEVARILTLKGSQVIFAPARITTPGVEPWRLYVRTRALENRVPIVSPNCVALPNTTGGSLIVGFSIMENGGIVYPKIVASAGAREKVLFAELDLKSIEPYRKERLESRRPELYSGLM